MLKQRMKACGRCVCPHGENDRKVRGLKVTWRSWSYFLPKGGLIIRDAVENRILNRMKDDRQGNELRTA